MQPSPSGRGGRRARHGRGGRGARYPLGAGRSSEWSPSPIATVTGSTGGRHLSRPGGNAGGGPQAGAAGPLGPGESNSESEFKILKRCAMVNRVSFAAVAVMALTVASITLMSRIRNVDQGDVLVQQYYAQPQFQVAQGQQLPEFEVSGTMETGSPAPQGVPLSFQLPVPLPGPSQPTPNIITIGPRPKKAPVCKECERQMKKIKVFLFLND